LDCNVKAERVRRSDKLCPTRATPLVPHPNEIRRLLVHYGREEALDVGGGGRRRSDLWLPFDDGIVLLEIKTHSGWLPE
jgi:hypothetical protein